MTQCERSGTNGSKVRRIKRSRNLVVSPRRESEKRRVSQPATKCERNPVKLRYVPKALMGRDKMKSPILATAEVLDGFIATAKKDGAIRHRKATKTCPTTGS